MSTSAYHRPTRFEWHRISQRANSYLVDASDRNGTPTPNPYGGLTAPMMPTLEIPDALFTDEEHNLLIQASTLIEEKFAIVYDGHASDVYSRTKEQVTKLLELSKASEDAQLSLDAQLAANQAEQARASLEAAQRKADHDAEMARLEAELAAKRAELAKAQSKEVVVDAPVG